jgi:inner membrane protein
VDTITHIVLGASTGELIAGKQLGKKALIIGAVANSLPDCDVLSNLWLDTDDALLAHRGFTHSFLCIALTSTVLAFLFRQWYKKRNIPFNFWIWFFLFELFLHIFIDAFNSYGTGWFEPFSHYRVSFNTIFVADPFYTIWLLIAFVMLLVLKAGSKSRRWWGSFGLGTSTLYFMYCIINKSSMDNQVKNILQRQHIPFQTFFTTPTPLNNWLWYVVAGTDSGYFIGYRSVFDSKAHLDLHYFPKNDFLLDPFRKHEDVVHLVRFSQGLYTVENRGEAVVFDDLRFGQIEGWSNADGRFVFYYFLEREKGNEMVVQRGRFAQWNRNAIGSLIKRIRGD